MRYLTWPGLPVPTFFPIGFLGGFTRTNGSNRGRRRPDATIQLETREGFGGTQPTETVSGGLVVAVSLALIELQKPLSTHGGYQKYPLDGQGAGG